MSLAPPATGDQTSSTVPLTVWPTLTDTQPGAIPPAAAARAIATFSQPDDLIVVIDGPVIIRDAAIHLHRRYTAVSRPTTDTGGRAWPSPAGHAGLVIDYPPAGDPQTLLPAFVQTAGLLRPGGILLTVHTPTAGATDPLTTGITTARAAGLRYLQHIVVLTTPISGGRLHPAGHPHIPPGGLVVPVHTDLAVFTTAGGRRD
ncbi:hypothetical protein [Candidatus Protofrankia californiensis]|uniref:hypothetical protein n=1 Tax=Candidatus Protofrankia californiensis TaxID=1839754 RepID=UPI001F496FFA|nr:hypothetical protein [Candidatus Protofrankia californiensis]